MSLNSQQSRNDRSRLLLHNHDDFGAVVVTTAIGVVLSFVGGMIYASYGMRLRDRERLRHACRYVTFALFMQSNQPTYIIFCVCVVV